MNIGNALPESQNIGQNQLHNNYIADTQTDR